MSAIVLENISFHYSAGTPVLCDISLRINKGERWAIIGKNGSGKSTLLKCIGTLLKTVSGTVSIEGKTIGSYRPMELAKLVAYVPQAGGRVPPPYTVADFIMLGRFPYQGFFALPAASDWKIVQAAMLLTDTEKLAKRPMNGLSGGELQRTFLAAAVAQRTGILLLDEPLSFLDPFHQEMVVRSLDRVHDEYTTTIITVTHDVNLALHRYTHICALVEGAPFFFGSVEAFKERAIPLLHDIYSMEFFEVAGNDDQPRFYMPHRGG